MNQNDPNKSPLIYEMDSSSEDQNQDQSDISNSSKSNENKKHQQQTQVSQIPADNFQTTQIIKIKPNSLQNAQNQQTSLSLKCNPKQKNPSSLIFSQSSQDKEEKSQQQKDYDLQSPAKLRRPKRKRQVSPAKRRPKQNKQPIFDDSQISMDQQNINQMKQFKQVQKAPSYLQIEDSQRYFDIKKQFKGLLKQNNNPTLHKKDTNQNQQIPFQRKIYQIQREYQKQQVQEINQFQEQNDQYQNDEGQDIYENDQGSQEESMPKYKDGQKQSAVKVLKNLPKYITVQTTVETLVMNPIPKGLRISCTFFIDKKFMGLSTQYNLIINSTNRTVLSAKKEHFSFTSSKFIISLNQNYITKRNDNLGFVGRLISNFSGNIYELTKRDINLTKSQQKQFPKDDVKFQDEQKDSQSLQAIINFQNNLWGYGGMRKMQILKLNKQKLTERDRIKRVNFQQLYQRGQISKLTKVQTCKPTYNKLTKRYSIDFGNKAKIPSAKNMIMQYRQTQKAKIFSKQKRQKQKIQKDTRQKSLLIAKEKDDRYLVQVGYPLSLYEAFAACLANNDSKLLVN